MTTTIDPIISGPWLQRTPSGVRAYESKDWRLFAWVPLQTGGSVDGMDAVLTATGDYTSYFLRPRGPGQPSKAEKIATGGYTGIVFWLPRGRATGAAGAGRAYDLHQLDVLGRGLDACTRDRFAAGVAAVLAQCPKVRTVIVYPGYIGAVPEWWVPSGNHTAVQEFTAERANHASLWLSAVRSMVPPEVQVVWTGDSYNNNPPTDINWRTIPDLAALRGVDCGAEPWPGSANPKLASPHWWNLFAQPEALKPVMGGAPRSAIQGPMLGFVVGDVRDTRPALTRAVDVAEQTGFAACELHAKLTAAEFQAAVQRRAAARPVLP